jgi:2-iminobutanoate/2-iminopropanoate deaminase
MTAFTYITEGAGVPPSVAPFSPGVVVGELCFISGQPAIDPATGEFSAGSLEHEWDIAFGNVLAVARAGGFGLDDFVYVHIALAEIGDYAAVNELYARSFADAKRLPARMTYQAGALPFGAKVEVQAVVGRSGE